ncbi:DNA-directed DNA polymerase [Tanacetum coccineum]
MQEVVKKEIMKLLDTGIIYPIADSPWVSPIQYVPKKGGITIVTNENDELVPTRTVKRMPFGLCTAPATFQRCMLAIFHDMIEESVKVFMDDFYVFGNSFDKCLNNLDKMLQRCKDAHLVLNWEKCHFMVKEGIVLRHKVSGVGLEFDKAKIDVISKLPPLPISKVDFAVGAVLGQKDVKNFHPIYFASKTLNLAQQKYTITKKELMAVVFEFDKFRSYLILSKTIVHTDHSALKHMFKKQDGKPHLVRWILLLQEFDIEIKDKKGTENVAADHLSRIDNNETSDDSEVDNNFPGETLMEINTRDEPWKNHIFLKPTGGHYGPNVTAKKVLDSGFYWPTIIKEAHTLVRLCKACQKTGNKSKRDEMPLTNIQIMAPKKRTTRSSPATTTTTTPVTNAQLKALIDQGVADALAERDATRSKNSEDNHDSRTSVWRQAPLACECTYVDFIKCKPLYFKGIEGVVELTQCFERMETVFRISNCIVENQIKFSNCTLLGSALTWWNSHVRTVGHDVKGTDVVGYNQCFQELALMCARMFPEESDKIEKYVGGLPDMIHGSVMASKPKTMQDAIDFATKLMDKKISTLAERQAKNKRKLDNNNQAQQQPPKKQGVAITYTVGPGERKEYVGTLPLYNKCKFHHNG